MLYSEILGQGCHKVDGKLHFLPSIELRSRIQAVVAGTAVVPGIVLPEIAEEQFPPAFPGLGVCHGLEKQLPSDFLLGHRLALEEFLQLAYILVAVIGYADSFLAVTAGTPRLLIIALETPRNVIMNHISHVRLVDAHSEGYGGDNHVNILHQEAVLILSPHLRIQSSVIRNSLYTIDNQHIGQFLNLLAAEAVDNAGLAGILFYILDDILLRLHLVPYLIIEIRPVERGLEYLRVLNAEILDNVTLDLRGGRCSEGDYRRPADFVNDWPDAPVFRSEIVPPVGNAMRLVNGVERNADIPEYGHVLLLGKAFRSYVQKFCDTGQQVFPDLGNLSLVQGGVQKMRNAFISGDKSPDGIYLILHQCNQWRDNDSRARHKERRQLVAQ